MPTALRAVRYVIPASLIAVGAVLWIVDGAGSVATAGALMVGLGISIFVINLFIRLAFSSQDDRDREERARRRWAEQHRAQH